MNNTRNIIAAVDIETTGRIPKVHEIVEIAIVPLTERFAFDEDIPVFHERVKAEYPGMVEEAALGKHRLDVTQGRSQREVVGDLILWMRDNRIGRIEPLGHNLSFDMRFIEVFLGDCGDVFSHIQRDTMRTAQAIQDASGDLIFKPYTDHWGINHSGTSLADIANALGVTLESRHSAIHDARAAAQCYVRMMDVMMDVLKRRAANR